MRPDAPTLRDRAAAIERMVRGRVLDDELDAADVAIGLLEEDPTRSDELVAAEVANILQAS
ncbi:MULTISPECIES: hypothetical protein [unclassified Bradyrhizobium]|uniref:hypothetical protein n=1 Tax=unclassified Bradyrhizobium TaxID=2631580 RepID=UPI0028F0FD81|nr:MULTISPECIES: hypothetical protein [unclassified Bradyrhizobium]